MSALFEHNGRAASSVDHVSCTVYIPTDLYHTIRERQAKALGKVSFSRMLVILIEKGLKEAELDPK